MKFGLSKSEMSLLMGVLIKNKDFIDKAIIFGSRARNDYKMTSDIDLAILFRKNKGAINSIILDFEKIDLIYTFDLVDYEKISNIRLKKNIDGEGIVIFSTNEKGELIMTIDRLN